MYYVDKSEITKILNLTRSSNGQTLEHIRRCNRLLKDKNLIWASTGVVSFNSKKPELREMVVKLLALTASDSDGEALNAIEKANQLLIKENLVWNEVLGDDTLAWVFPISMTKEESTNEPVRKTARKTRRGTLPIEILDVLNMYPDWILKSELVKLVMVRFGRDSGAIYRQITSSQPTSKWVRTGNLLERRVIEQSENEKYVRLSRG